MKNRYLSLDLLIKLGSEYHLNYSDLEYKFINYYNSISKTQKKDLSLLGDTKNFAYLLYLIFLISPFNLVIQLFFKFYYQYLAHTKVLLNVNNSGIHLWQDFKNLKDVNLLAIDSFTTKFFAKKLPFKYSIFILKNYLYLLYQNFKFKKFKENTYLFDLEVFRKFLNDYMFGCFLGSIKTTTILEGAAYTLNLPKYLGIKKINKIIKVVAFQFHAASTEPSMSLFQADKILSINKNTSLNIPQVFGNRAEESVGSRCLINFVYKSNRPIKYNPNKKSFLILLGNSMHPKGEFYGPSHYQIYHTFLNNLIRLSKEFNFWDFYFLEHRTVEFRYEFDYFKNTPIKYLNKNSNVYEETLKHLFVVTFGSTLVPELFPHHPNLYMYSPSSESPFRVTDKKFRFISSYETLVMKLHLAEKKFNEDLYDYNFLPIINPQYFENNVFNSALL